MREPDDDDDDVDGGDAAGGDGGVFPGPASAEGAAGDPLPRRPADQPPLSDSRRVATPRVCVYKVIVRRRRRRNNASLIITCVTTPAERAEARQD